MELTENTAAKWEWVRDETAKLASSIASKQEIIKSVSSTLDKLIADLDTELETFERLKHSSRQGSATRRKRYS